MKSVKLTAWLVLMVLVASSVFGAWDLVFRDEFNNGTYYSGNWKRILSGSPASNYTFVNDTDNTMNLWLTSDSGFFVMDLLHNVSLGDFSTDYKLVFSWRENNPDYAFSSAYVCSVPIADYNSGADGCLRLMSYSGGVKGVDTFGTDEDPFGSLVSKVDGWHRYNLTFNTTYAQILRDNQTLKDGLFNDAITASDMYLIFQVVTAHPAALPLVFTNVSFYSRLLCAEDWQPYFLNLSCNSSDLLPSKIFYEDLNGCNTSLFLPSNNGTVNKTFDCDFCAEDIQPFYTAWSDCFNASMSRVKYYVDLNFSTCCLVTNLSSDCHLLNGSYTNTSEFQGCPAEKSDVFLTTGTALTFFFLAFLWLFFLAASWIARGPNGRHIFALAVVQLGLGFSLALLLLDYLSVLVASLVLFTSVFGLIGVVVASKA